MFDIIFSSLPLRLFHTMPSILFIILQCGPFSFTSAPYLLLQITLSPFFSSCYHSSCHYSSTLLVSDTLFPPHPHLSRLFLGSLLAPLFPAPHTSVFFSYIHLLLCISCFSNPSPCPSCLSICIPLLFPHHFFTCPPQISASSIVPLYSLQFSFNSFTLTPTSSTVPLALSFLTSHLILPPSLLPSQGD